MKTQLRDSQEYVIQALNTADDALAWKNSHIKPLKSLIGSYKGHLEQSYLLPYPNRYSLSLAKIYKQESILVIGNLQNGKRTARIVSIPNLKTVATGNFVNVGRNKPDGDWTYDIETGDYYIME